MGRPPGSGTKLQWASNRLPVTQEVVDVLEEPWRLKACFAKRSQRNFIHQVGMNAVGDAHPPVKLDRGTSFLKVGQRLKVTNAFYQLIDSRSAAAGTTMMGGLTLLVKDHLEEARLKPCKVYPSFKRGYLEPGGDRSQDLDLSRYPWAAAAVIGRSGGRTFDAIPDFGEATAAGCPWHTKYLDLKATKRADWVRAYKAGSRRTCNAWRRSIPRGKPRYPGDKPPGPIEQDRKYGWERKMAALLAWENNGREGHWREWDPENLRPAWTRSWELEPWYMEGLRKVLPWDERPDAVRIMHLERAAEVLALVPEDARIAAEMEWERRADPVTISRQRRQRLDHLAQLIDDADTT